MYLDNSYEEGVKKLRNNSEIRPTDLVRKNPHSGKNCEIGKIDGILKHGFELGKSDSSLIGETALEEVIRNVPKSLIYCDYIKDRWKRI